MRNPPRPKAPTETADSPSARPHSPNSAFLVPWLVLVATIALHVADETLTGFLAVYNPTVLAARARWPWFPAPAFSFPVWISGLLAGILLCLALSPLAAANNRAFRGVAWLLAALMLLNGIGHIVGTVAGHTFPEIRYPRPMPGFYTAPLLLAASAWLMHRLRETAPA